MLSRVLSSCNAKSMTASLLRRAVAPSSTSSFATLAPCPGQARVGDKIPDTVFHTRHRSATAMAAGEENPFDWTETTAHGLMGKGRYVLFALPGAFTPTCSNSQLPSYVEHYDAIKACGVDEVFCLSVNDAFVMRQWGLAQGLTEDMKTGEFSTVKLVPDGAADFTRAMGMLSNWSAHRGFGERSYRYAMVVQDGVVEHMMCEPGYAPVGPAADPYEVSDAASVLSWLQSNKK